MSSQKFISADDYRVPKEKLVLNCSLAALACVLLLGLGLSFGLILIIVGISVAFVKIRQGQLIGQCIRVSENQLSDVYQAAKTASGRLSMRTPDVFVNQDPVINAYALGFVGKKSVVLHSATVESMSKHELTYILGHEFSHIKCDHTTWSTITSSAGSVKIPILSDILGFIFLAWSRKAEYTCDRGGLIACRDLEAALSALGKLAVGKNLFEDLSLDDLFEQMKDIEQDAVARLAQAFGTHPYIIHRIHALKRFYESGTYNRLTEMGSVMPAAGKDTNEIRGLKEEANRLRREVETLKKGSYESGLEA